MNKRGVHVSAGSRRGFGEFLLACAQAGRPIPVIFSLDQDVWPDVVRYSPETVVIFRHQPKDSEGGGLDGPQDMYTGDPQASAQAWMAKVLPIWRKNRAHYYAPVNEQQPATLEQFTWFNSFTIECQAIAQAEGFKLALYAFSVGTPADVTNPAIGEPFTAEDAWQRLLPSLQLGKVRGDILLLHEYGLNSPAANGGPDNSLRASAPHLALRYRRVYQFLHANQAVLQLVISEASAGIGYTTDFSGWVADTDWYDSELARDRIVLGCCLYQVGGDENFSGIFSQLQASILNAPVRNWEGDPVVGIEDPPPPDPVECRGKPRIQFEKKVVLFPPTAKYGKEWYAAVGPSGLDVTKSADVAGLGDLDVRQVVAVNPAEWPGDLVAWFAEHYPGVQVQAVRVPAPGKLERILLIDDVPVEEFPTVLPVPYINQLEGTDANYAPGDCGPANLAMALNFFGKPCTVDQVSQATGQGPGFQFTSWGQLDTAAKAFGHQVTSSISNAFAAIRSEINSGRPVIALINYAKLPSRNKHDPNYNHGHFLLIVGYTSSEVIYHDPYWRGQAGANLRLTWAEFDVCWSTPNADFTYPRQLGKLSAYVSPPPAIKALVGLHLRADPLDHNSPHLARDLAVISAARIEAVKIKTSDTFDSLNALIAAGQNPARMVLRLFAAGNNPSLKNAVQFYAEQSAWLAYFASKGGKYVEVHNEPNLTIDGMGFAWSTPTQFATWYTAVKNLIKANHPGLLVGFPGLSPQPAGSAITLGYTSDQWLAECDAAIRGSDWVGAHAYWVNPALMGDPWHGGHWKKYLTFGKPILITEFASLASTPDQMGEQYVQYYAGLTAPVVAAFAYVSSATNNEYGPQRWREEGGALNAIAGKVGAR